MVLMIVSIVFYIFLSIVLSIKLFICFTTGGHFPYGHVKVYKEKNAILTEWTVNGQSYAKKTVINKKKIRKNHLYLEESGKNFIFLLKDLPLD